MTGRLTCLAAAAVMTAALCGVARAELTAKQEKEAQTLIKQCGDTDYQTREKATKALLDMGMDVLPLVRKQAQDSTDAEMKMRCSYVVSTLIEKAELAPLEPSKVTLDVKDKLLPEVVKELARQSGNSEMVIDPALVDHKVTVSLKDVPYWQAVDEVCKSAGACYAPKPRDARMGIMEIVLMPRTDSMMDLGTVVGATSIKIGSATRQEFKRVGFRGGPQINGQNSLGFEVQAYMEDRLPLMRVGIQLTNVITADGVNHANQRQNTGGFFGRAPGGNVGAYWAMGMTWSDEAGAAEGLVTLGGTLDLTYGFQPKEIKAEKIFDKDDIEVSKDDRKLTVKNVKRQGDTVIVTLMLEDPVDEGTGFGQQGGGSEWGMFLLDPQGKRHGSLGMMSGSTTASGTGVKLQGTIVFQSVPAAPGDWSLVYAYPGKIVKRSSPFMIQGVPLP